MLGSKALSTARLSQQSDLRLKSSLDHLSLKASINEFRANHGPYPNEAKVSFREAFKRLCAYPKPAADSKKARSKPKKSLA
jgi:hypothetical protein